MSWITLLLSLTLSTFGLGDGFQLHRLSFHSRRWKDLLMSGAELPVLVPTALALKAQDIEIVRVLGKVDIIQEAEVGGGASRATSVRIFEARVLSSVLGDPATDPRTNEPLPVRCFLKEYMPEGEEFGRRELSTTRKLSTLWNKLQLALPTEGAPKPGQFVPFPILLGQLRTDQRIENPEFQLRWSQRFQTTKPPSAGNLWLIFKWDESTFKTLRSYPALPQLVQGLDYFRKDERLRKRWDFMKRIMRKALLSVDFLHRAGYCHNALSTDSLWLTTTNQMNMANLDVRLTDLGTAQRLADLGPLAREGVTEDLYSLGLVFLELVVEGLAEDDAGAVRARGVMSARMRERDKGFEKVAWGEEGRKGEGGGAAGAAAAAAAGGVGGGGGRADWTRSGPEMVERVADLMASASSSLGVGVASRKGPLSYREWQQLFEEHCDSDFQQLRRAVRDVSGEASTVLEASSGEAFKLIIKLLTRGRLVDPTDGKPIPISGRSLIREFPFLKDANRLSQ